MVTGGLLRMDELFPLATCSIRGVSLPCPAKGERQDSPMLVRRWKDYMQYRIERRKFATVYHGPELERAQRAVEAAIGRSVWVDQAN